MMQDYIENLLETPADMKGIAVMPATNHLFEIKPNAALLDKEKLEEYHHLTTKLLYLSKQVCPDITTCVSFEDYTTISKMTVSLLPVCLLSVLSMSQLPCGSSFQLPSYLLSSTICSQQLQCKNCSYI